MSYIVLARKWRPQNFDEVVGQQFITTTLKNSISSGKIAHAMLFSGPRGVGKTSTARILAKSVNCVKGPTPTPCSACTNCVEISEGKSIDIIEIDAASHTGVNDVREIIENIKYLPVSGKTKVYIIDEVHMLSNSAFNALLKTLEEPPEHALFILATTEVNKIPLTILSRCQKYDFKKVSSAEIRNSLKQITSTENIEIDDSTIRMISSESDGSLRDALSLLDQLNTTFDGKIQYEEASKLFGIFDSSYCLSLFENILAQDPKKCLQIIIELNQKGINPKKTIEQLLRIVRYSVFIKVCGTGISSDLTEDELSSVNQQVTRFDLATLENIFNQTLKASEDISRSAYPEIALEMSIVKLASLYHSLPVSDILDKLESISLNTTSKTNEISGTKTKKALEKPNIKNVADNTTSKQTTAKKNLKEENIESLSLNNFIEYVKNNESMIGIYLEKADKIEITGTEIKLVYNSQSVFSDSIQKKDNIDTIKNLLKKRFLKEFNINVVINSPDHKKPGKEKDGYDSSHGKNIINNKALRDALDTFGGRLIKVKNNLKGDK
jgi:DNA polymerase-3 subunit gamma/tau